MINLKYFIAVLTLELEVKSFQFHFLIRALH